MLEAAGNDTGLMEEAVTPDHVAQVVSRWTGVPVERMLEGDAIRALDAIRQAAVEAPGGRAHYNVALTAELASRNVAPTVVKVPTARQPSYENVRAELQRCSGTMFWPEAVDALLAELDA